MTNTNTRPQLVSLAYRDLAPTVALALDGREIPGRSGYDAKVTVSGATLHLSRLAGEAGWTVDAYIPAGTAMPRFMNGWGSRCTRLVPAPAEVAALLDGLVA
jgi:hypothetical protein